MDLQELQSAVRDIPDFPKPGIVFKDITPILASPVHFREAIDRLIERMPGDVDRIMGIEARGFLLASAIAYRTGLGLVPARKPGKLPFRTLKETYDLEYGKDALEIHTDAVRPGHRVLIVDDLLATGGTALAAARLVEQSGGVVAGILFFIELLFLEGRKRLADYPVEALIGFS